MDNCFRNDWEAWPGRPPAEAAGAGIESRPSKGAPRPGSIRRDFPRDDVLVLFPDCPGSPHDAASLAYSLSPPEGLTMPLPWLLQRARRASKTSKRACERSSLNRTVWCPPRLEMLE